MILRMSVFLDKGRWEKTHALLIEGGLNYAAIRDSVTNSAIGFRDGVTQLFEILEVENLSLLCG